MELGFKSKFLAFVSIFFVVFRLLLHISRNWVIVARNAIGAMRLEAKILRRENAFYDLRGRVRSGARIRGIDRIFCEGGVHIGEGSELRVENSAHPNAGSITLCARVQIADYSCLVARAGDRLVIEEGSSINGSCVLGGDIRVGRDVLFARNVFASTRSHRFSDKPHASIREQDTERVEREGACGRPQDSIVIDDDCWIGWGTVITEGVHVGRGVVLGANAVVTGDIPPYAIAVGAPARVLRSRLVYRPPNHLVAARDRDRPYFYSGFARNAKPGRGLHIDRPSATIILAGADDATTLIAAIRAERAGCMRMQFGTETQILYLVEGENRLVVQAAPGAFASRLQRPFADPFLVVRLQEAEDLELVEVQLQVGG
jgi:acetyltransferase-like isoleucine patch superfamily enzyme